MNRRVGKRRIDLARLAGAHVELRDRAAIDDVWVLRIRRDHAAFIARRDLVKVLHD